MTKKLVICIPSLRLGGAAKIALNLTEQYLEEEIDVTIILTDGNSKDLDFTSLPSGVNLIKLPAIKVHHFIRPFINVFFLARYFRNLKPDAILAVRHDATAVSSMAWKLTLKKACFVIREINPITRTLNRNSIMISILKKAYGSATAVIANSNDVADALKSKNWLDAGKIYTIDNPVLTKGFFTKAQEPLVDTWIKASSSPLIITIGRLDKMKDQQTLIRAFALVRKNIDCRLMLIGDGPEAASLRRLVDSLGVSGSVKLPGALENPYPLLKHAEIFVLSSMYEGFGNVLVEALSLGKKIISTACPGGPAYILNHGEFGKLFPIGDYEQLAVEIGNALVTEIDTVPLIARSKDFSTEKIAKLYSQLLFNC